MPAIARHRVSIAVARRTRASQLASVPHVVTSGASGPAAAPAAIVIADIGTSERNERTLGAPPDTWMLSTSSSTSPGLPSTRAITATRTPTPPSTTNCSAPLKCSGASPCCSRWMTRRYAAPIAPPPMPTSSVSAEERGRMPERQVFETRVFAEPSGTYRSTIYLVRRSTPPTSRDAEYRELLAFRTAMRRFLRWSEKQATALGITPAQHQLLLAIRGHDGAGADPTIGDVAESLLLRHHSAVGLVDRAVSAGLVERHADSEDQRVVRLRLTALGARRLRQLAGLHLAELRRMMPAIGPALFAEPIETADARRRGEQHEFLGARRGRDDRRRPGERRGRERRAAVSTSASPTTGSPATSRTRSSSSPSSSTTEMASSRRTSRWSSRRAASSSPTSVAASLHDHGFDVAMIEGGIAAWKAAGHPLVKADGTKA